MLEPADQLAIYHLFACYANATDTVDVEAMVALFSKDGVFQSGVHRFEGRQAILTFVKNWLAAPSYPEEIRGLHFFTQPLIRMQNGQISATSSMIHVMPTTPISIGVLATYQDTIIREDGAWRFALRLMTRAS